MVELYPVIPHAKILNVLRKQYDKFMYKKVHTEDIIKMADFILRNNFFELNSKFFQRISGLLWVLNDYDYAMTTLKQKFSRHNP